jgi:hypothetical protein
MFSDLSEASVGLNFDREVPEEADDFQLASAVKFMNLFRPELTSKTLKSVECKFITILINLLFIAITQSQELYPLLG